MIEKIRHGAEISSSKLNEIIQAVNETNNEHQTIRELGETIKTTVKEVYNTLEKYSEQVGEHLDSIPEIKNLYADILLSRDTVDWIDIAEDETDTTAFIAAALDGYEGNLEEPAQRLKVIRGTTSQITLNTPEVKDKQILIAYDKDSNRGIMYFDIGTRRIPVSASGDVYITALVPELEFETLASGEEVLKIVQADGTTKYSKDLRGTAGTAGAQGPQGPKGEKGDQGERGLQGIQGTKGQDGATTRLSVWFSNYSSGLNATENYNNHKYMGIKTYLSTDNEATILARPIKWFRISGDTLYPVYDPSTGYLTFTTEKPAESSFYIRGEQGPQGPKGEAPEIAFKLADGSLITLESISASGKHVYDAGIFRGEKGDAGIQGIQGPKGETGKTPTIKLIGESVSSSENASIEDTTPIGSQYDAEFTIKLPRGKEGLSIFDVVTDPDGSVKLYLSRTPDAENPTLDRIVNLGILKGDKGEKGDPATIAIKSAVNSTAELPLTNVTNGDAYVVKSIVDGESISELYICVNATGTTVGEMYVNLGNIKGEKGDKGSDGVNGSTWMTGTVVTQSGVFNLEAGYKIGDYYLNIKTGRVYKIIAANGTSYTFTEETTDIDNLKGPQGDKGPKGETGSNGISINKIEKTSSLDNVDTYTITYTDSSISTFTITNGKDGNDGKDGINGSLIYNGSGEPNEALGSINDYYLNTSNYNLYTKTSATEWTYKATLKGADGINGEKGADGNKIYTLQGTVGPTNTTYSDIKPGDLCITLGNYNLYVVNDAGSWDPVGSIKGNQGVSGRPQRVFLMNSTLSTDINYIFVTSSSTVNNSVAAISNQYIVNGIEYTNIAIGDIAININANSPYYGCLYTCVEVGSTTSTWQQLVSEYAKSIQLVEKTMSIDYSTTLSPNIYYKLTANSSSDTSIYLSNSIPNMYNEYMFEIVFTSTTADLAVYGTDSQPIKWAGGLHPDAFKQGVTYLCSIVNNIGMIMEVADE